MSRRLTAQGKIPQGTADLGRKAFHDKCVDRQLCGKEARRLTWEEEYSPHNPLQADAPEVKTRGSSPDSLVRYFPSNQNPRIRTRPSGLVPVY